jgi:hypothetical protein
MADGRLTGSCLCGAVSYEVRGPFTRFGHCHCSRCRKATGAAHATGLYADPANFAWLSGADRVVRFDLPSARSFSTTFCRTCGSPLPHPTRSGRELIVPAGSLDTEPSIRPRSHIHWASRAPWSCGPDSLPCFGGDEE